MTDTDPHHVHDIHIASRVILGIIYVSFWNSGIWMQQVTIKGRSFQMTVYRDKDRDKRHGSVKDNSERFICVFRKLSGPT